MSLPLESRHRPLQGDTVRALLSTGEERDVVLDGQFVTEEGSDEVVDNIEAIWVSR